MSTSMREALEKARETKSDGYDKTVTLTFASADDAHAAHQAIRAALSSPAPDRLSEAERATIEIARTVATKLSETQANVFPVECNAMMQSGHRTVAALLAIIDRLSRQPSRTEELTADIPEQAQRVGARFVPSAEKIETYEAARAARQPEAEPVAWLRDLQPDAEDEALAVCNRIDPGAFPVYTSPRLDREKVKALIQWVQETLLDPFDWIGTGDSFSASLYERRTREKWKELADALMRETR